MPEQLPSAILDSANSFDSLFTLNLDTKQRFDNILSGIQKPIDYPIPDYNKYLTPQGLSQNELLDPNKSIGSIGDGIFSPDPKISSYATDKLRSMQSQLPVTQGIGRPDRFQYSKEMDKYLKGDFGYNPYMSIADNEDFNYRYDYLNQNVFERIFKNTLTGLSRFAGSTVLKLGQTLGHLGSMIGNGIEEIFNSKDNNFMSDVADNSLSRWFEGLEEDMKNSNLLSVFKPRGWEDKGFFQKLGHGAFWTDEVADGAAFMGEMVASMYLLGGLGRIGALGRLGSTPINLTKSLSRLGSTGRYTGRVLDSSLKLATGAQDLSGIGRWAFATTSESAFEASGLYKTRKDQLLSDREAGYNTFTDEQINTIAGDSAAASFKANMLILSASNAFENRFIFSPIFKRLGLDQPSSRGGLINVSKSTQNLEEVAKATRRAPEYKTWLGKKLNWKDSNSRLRFYGSRALSATAMEGFWEENAQLAAERLASADNLTLTSFLSKFKTQTLAALKGDDPEASTSIGLGAIIGGGAVTAISKIRGGDRLFQGERRKIEADTLATIEVYEEFRKGFLNYQDIYVRDPETGKPIMDTDGNLQIDEVKAAGLLDGTNKFLSKQQAADKVEDPLFRKHLQDAAMTDYVVAAKMAGIFDKSLDRFGSLVSLGKEDLENLGLDPNTTVDGVYLKDSLEQFGKIYDSVYNSPPSRLKSGETEGDERKRKDMLYQASTSAYSSKKIINEYQSKMSDRDFPSVFSPEAEGNTSEIQQFNSLIYQQEAIDEFAEMTKEHGNFYDGYIKFERNRINKERNRLQRVIDEKVLEDDPIGLLTTNLIHDDRGFYYSRSKYEGYSKTERSLLMGIENDSQKKHAEYTNLRNHDQYLANKFSNPIDGIKNSKDYLSYVESIQKRDEEEDTKEQSPTPVETPPEQQKTPTEQPVTTPTPPPSKKEVVKNEDIISSLTNMISTLDRELDEQDEVDYIPLISFIEENEGKYSDIIRSTILKYAKDRGDIVLEQIRTGTFKPKSIQERPIDKVALIVGNSLESISPKISDPVFEYVENVLTQISNYKVVLTEEEKRAIDVISNIPNLSESAISPYTNIISDPNSSDQDKKEALRGLSDQYLDPITSGVVGPLLGPEGREALDDLGYPVPPAVELPISESQVTTEVSPPTEVSEPSLFDQVAPEGELPSDVELEIEEVPPVAKEPISDQEVELSQQTPISLKVGDTVIVNTEKDGISVIKELRGDKALLEDGRQVALKNLSLQIVEEPEQELETQPQVIDNTEGSGIQPDVPIPPQEPPPPIAPENSDEESVTWDNAIDRIVDEAKLSGTFVFPQNMPEEVVMEGKKAKIVDGAIQLKTTQGDQQRQLARQHNILKKMGEKTNPINFWSEDEEGNLIYKVKLELAGAKNEAKYLPWVYNTAKGLINKRTGKPYDFPFIVAMVTDQEGKYIYFDDEGNISDPINGLPFGFIYTVLDYYPDSLKFSRRGLQLGTGELLNGTPNYLSEDPLGDLRSSIQKGAKIFGTILDVTSGKLSTYNVDNSGATWAKQPQRRTIKEMEASGDILDTSTLILKTGRYFEYASTITPEVPTQRIKVGQPFLFDEKSGLRLPLRGKLIKDLTLDGKPFITKELEAAIQDLRQTGVTRVTESKDPTPEQQDMLEDLFNLLRALIYSQDTPIFIDEDRTTITMLDQRPTQKSLLDTELNYSTNIEALRNPFTNEEFSYEDFVKENFLSGAVPAELTKGQKSFEKLNRRIIFEVDKTHQEILEAIGARPDVAKTVRIKSTDFNKFVNKTFRRRGGTSTITITSFSEGKFIITGPSGTITQTTEEFMKSLQTLEEVKLPAPSEEVKQDFENNIKLSEAKQKELNEKAKNMSKDDLDNLNFDC